MKTHWYKWIVFLTFILLTSTLLGHSCGRDEEPHKISLALDWFPNSNHAGFYMAQKNGYYDDEGLLVEIFVPTNPEDVLKTVGAGRDDLGISYQAEVLLARGEGVPVISVAALVQHPLNSIMALKESGITRPSQLKGKKVGVTGIPFEEALFSAMLEHDHTSLEEVTVVNVGFDLVPALIGGKVDAIVGAYWTHESIVMEMQGFQVNVLRMEEWGVPDFYELVVVASEDTVNNRPDMVQSFLKATARGFNDAIRNPDKAVEVLVQANPETDIDLESQGIKLLAHMWTDGAPVFGWQTPERWYNLAKWMKATGLLKEGLEESEAFSSEFVSR